MPSRPHGHNAGRQHLAGAVSAIFGIVVLAAPGAGALVFIWAIDAYSIVFGVLIVVLPLRLRKHRHA